jgi:hypothetical protein
MESSASAGQYHGNAVQPVLMMIKEGHGEALEEWLHVRMDGEDTGTTQGETEITFPVYRKTLDDRHFYRIEAFDRFTEVQRLGNRYMVHRVTAKAYPEKLRIADMIQCLDGRYGSIGPGEWAEVWGMLDRTEVDTE